jgi:hypothetical protein
LKPTRTAEIALGLAVAAGIAAAALAVRARDAGREAPGASAPSDLTHADATLDLGDVSVLVSAGPRPLRALAPTRFRFRAEANGAPVVLAGAAVSFTMTMPMGDHRHRLVAAVDGWHEAEAALPLCPSGGRRWFGTLDFTLAGRARSARFAFDLRPPTSPPGDGTPPSGR